MKPTQDQQDILRDLQWLFLGTGAFVVLNGLVKALSVWSSGAPFVIYGSIFLVLAIIPHYWIRFVMLVFWIEFLVLDFLIRANPISLLFLCGGFYLFYKMILFIKKIS